MSEPGTIGYFIDQGERLSVHCENTNCNNFAYVDLNALAQRLGRDHSTMHWDLLPHFACEKCKAEGRPKKIGFIHHANTTPRSVNPYLRNSNGY